MTSTLACMKTPVKHVGKSHILEMTTTVKVTLFACVLHLSLNLLFTAHCTCTSTCMSTLKLLLLDKNKNVGQGHACGPFKLRGKATSATVAHKKLLHYLGYLIWLSFIDWQNARWATSSHNIQLVQKACPMKYLWFVSPHCTTRWVGTGLYTKLSRNVHTSVILCHH